VTIAAGETLEYNGRGHVKRERERERERERGVTRRDKGNQTFISRIKQNIQVGEKAIIGPE
jgi:hypothetical protein